MVASTCSLTTPRGPPGKADRANRWRPLCEGGCGVECGSSATDMGSCDSVRVHVVLSVFCTFLKAALVFVHAQVCFVYVCNCAFVCVRLCVKEGCYLGEEGGGMVV